MSPLKVLGLIVILAMSVAMLGCSGGGGDKKRTASRGRFGLKKKNRDVADKGKKSTRSDLEDLSPEGSMRRDLKRLQEREQAQVKLLTQMRSSLDMGSEQMRGEEEKLREIRDKIHRYDTAMQRYEMASRSRPPKEYQGESATVPVAQFRDRPVQNVRAAYANESAAYGPSGNQGYESRGQARAGETVLYDPAAAPGRAPSPFSMNAPSGRSGPDAGYGREGSQAYAAPQQPRGYAPPPAAGQDRYAGNGWEPAGALFSRNANRQSPRGTGPAGSRQGRNEGFWPEPPKSGQTVAPVTPAAPVAVKPSAPPPRPAPQTKKAFPLPPVESDAEVFTPDLFLSGGR